MMQIFVRGCLGKTVTLNVESYETICNVKRKLTEKEGFGSNWHLGMIYYGLVLEDGHTLAYYNILEESTLLVLIQKPSTKITQVKPLPTEQQAPLALATPPATQTTPNTNTDTHPIINDGEYTPGLATCADTQPSMSNSTYETKLDVFVHYQAKATAALSDLIPEFRTRPSSELEDLKRKMASKERELEATISKLTHKIKVFSGQSASYESQGLALEAENKRTRVAAYTEGLKEGKAKRFKSVEFLHHLTDASMQYFDYGFDSCQKQAEQQGFVGQLNKDSALKDAPDLKGWETK